MPNYFELFPKELLLKTFSYLRLDEIPRLMLVCRSWFSVLHSSESNLFWKLKYKCHFLQEYKRLLDRDKIVKRENELDFRKALFNTYRNMYERLNKNERSFANLIKEGRRNELKQFIQTYANKAERSDVFEIDLSWFVLRDSKNYHLIQFAKQAILDYFYELVHETNPDIKTLLRWAAFFNQASLINSLPFPNADFNHTDSSGATPLWLAAQNGHFEMMSRLLYPGAPINRPNHYGETPFWIAAHNGHLSIVLTLMEVTATDINKPNKKKETLIWAAVRNGHANVAEVLLDKGESIAQIRKDFATLLWVAAENGHVNVISLLLDRAPRLINRANFHSQTPLWIAARNGQSDAVAVLLALGASHCMSDFEDETPLWIAACYGHLEAVRALLAKSYYLCDLKNKYGATPLWIVSQNGHREVAALLLEARCSGVNECREPTFTRPLFMAALMGYLEIAKLLLRNGAEVDIPRDNGETPLFAALQREHIEVAALLLSKGADITHCHKEGFSPLQIATRYGRHGVMRFLLENGVYVDEESKNGESPLLVAVEQNDLDTVKFLIEAGADVDNFRHVDEVSSLFIAAKKGYIDIAKLLLERGADVDLSNLDGESPLWIAAKEGHLEIVIELLAAGAYVNKANYCLSETPLYVAIQGGYIEIVIKLLATGASVFTRNYLGTNLLGIAKYKEYNDIYDLIYYTQIAKRGHTLLEKMIHVLNAASNSLEIFYRINPLKKDIFKKIHDYLLKNDQMFLKNMQDYISSILTSDNLNEHEKQKAQTVLFYLNDILYPRFASHSRKKKLVPTEEIETRVSKKEGKGLYKKPYSPTLFQEYTSLADLSFSLREEKESYGNFESTNNGSCRMVHIL